MASGSLLTKIHKAYKEFIELGLVDDARFQRPRRTGHRLRADRHGDEEGAPTSSSRCRSRETIAKSLAIGTPADGYYAIHAMKEDRRFCRGCTDDEVVEGIRLLAEYEGIFAETAGGVTVACAKKLIDSGKIPADESAVLCITGHGLKTQEAIIGKCGEPRVIKPSLREFEERIYNPDTTATAAA